jgi:hypothetical protein
MDRYLRVPLSEVHLQNRVHGPCTPTESAASNTQAQKADHYILCVRIGMRSGAYASSRQDTDYAGAGDGQEFMGGGLLAEVRHA